MVAYRRVVAAASATASPPATAATPSYTATIMASEPLARTPHSTRHNSHVFFGLPIVGFFRAPPRHTNCTTDEERRPIAAQPNPTYDYDVERPTSAAATTPRTGGESAELCATATATVSPRRRTGRELWEILRYHVHHETFAIADWRTKEERKPGGVVKNFDEMVLPYDFSVRDCLLALAVYLAISVIAFSFVFERWSVIDSMYFACVSFTTIGYGDLSPTSPGGRLFCIFFALGGVAVLAIALGVLGSNIVEAEVKAMEATKQELVKEMLKIMKRRGKRSPSDSNAHHKKPRVLRLSSSTGSDPFAYLRDFDDPNMSDGRDASRSQQLGLFCVMFRDLLCVYGPSLTPLFLGALLIGHHEGWSFIDSIYYCVVTTTTIGYGDLVPQKESMKLFAVFFIPLSVGAMGHFLGTVANFIVEQRRKAYDKQLWKHELTLQDLKSMSSTADGVVSELDFVVFMLHAMKKCDKELIDHIREHFRVLDLTNSNTLCRGDLELMARQKLRSTKSKLSLSAYRRSLTTSFSEDDLGN